MAPTPAGGGGMYPTYPYPLNPFHDPQWPEAEPETEEDVVRRREAERLSRLDLVDVLTADHETISALLADLTGGGPAVHRRQVAEVLIAEVSRHTAVEQRHLHPTVRDSVSDGERRAEAELRADHELGARLRQLADAELDSDEFGQACRGLIDQVTHHRRAQEEELFPRLREVCDGERLRELAHRARSARDLAPTRPHRHVPEGGVLRAATDPLVGAVDKIRDEVSGRPTEPGDLEQRPAAD